MLLFRSLVGSFDRIYFYGLRGLVMTVKEFTKEQHKELKLQLFDIMETALRITELVGDDIDLLKITEKFFKISKEFSEKMVDKGYGDT